MSSAAAADDSPAACANCGHAFGTPAPKFCPDCGQESRVRAPKLSEFLQQFGGAYFSTEGALWRTLWLLLRRPGELTRQYLAGRRKHYVLPLRLYLTVSVLVLLLVRLMATVQIDAGNAGKNLEASLAENNAVTSHNLNVSIGRGRAGLKDGKFFCSDLPQWMCHRLERRFVADPKAMAAEFTGMKDRFMGNLGAAMFLLLPAFALGLKLVYLNRRLRYTEHLVFSLHVHTFWFLALALVMTNVSVVAALAMAAVPVYTLLALRRVYGGGWWPRLARAAVLCALYLWFVTVAMVGLGLWAVLA